eukprot:gene18896-20798_t
MAAKLSKKRSLQNGLMEEEESEHAAEDDNGHQKIYLDYNATTPLEPSVLDAIYASLKYAWGNPSSSYAQGKMAKKIVTESRKHVAEMINADASEIIFTSGGTEANNMIFHSIIQDYQQSYRGGHNSQQEYIDKCACPHVITSIIEHDSVILALKALEKDNKISLTVLPVSKETGHVVVKDVTEAVQRETTLISIMLANNETGIIQPIKGISAEIAKVNKSRSDRGLRRILVHTDAAQAIGKIEVNAKDLGVDYLTIVGHKFYAPRIGALYSRHLGQSDSAPLHPMLYGGGQERNYRPGTENTGMIAGLGEACRLVTKNIAKYNRNMTKVKDYLELRLSKTFGKDVHFNSRFNNNSNCLPNTCNVSIIGDNLEGRNILAVVKRLEASVGAACHSDCGNKPSHILISSGIPEEIARNALRLSVGRYTTTEDIDVVINDLRQVVSILKGRR